MNLIFDYEDLFYDGNNPLNYLIKKEVFTKIRNSFWELSLIDQMILKEDVILYKTIVNEKLEKTLETLKELYLNE